MTQEDADSAYGLNEVAHQGSDSSPDHAGAMSASHDALSMDGRVSFPRVYGHLTAQPVVSVPVKRVSQDEPSYRDSAVDDAPGKAASRDVKLGAPGGKASSGDKIDNVTAEHAAALAGLLDNAFSAAFPARSDNAIVTGYHAGKQSHIEADRSMLARQALLDVQPGLSNNKTASDDLTAKIKEQISRLSSPSTIMNVPSGDRRIEDAETIAAELAATIEGEIIPRLMLNLTCERTESDAASGKLSGKRISADDREDFVHLLIDQNDRVCTAFLSALRARGVSTQVILVNLLTSSARRLGEMWEYDDISFADVTVGICTLERLLRRELAPTNSHAALTDTAGERRVLISAMPGERHVFGSLLVEESFRQAGWHVRAGPFETVDEILYHVRNEWFSCFGLSVGGSQKLEESANLIQAVRSASLNKSVSILVGGNLFLADPDAVGRVGADAMALDGRGAVRIAEACLEASQMVG